MTQQACPEWRDKLTMRREDLSPSDCDNLTAHLQNCASCQVTVIEYEKMFAQLHMIPEAVIAQLVLKDNPEFVKIRPLEMEAAIAPITQPPKQIRLHFTPLKSGVVGLLIACAILAPLLHPLSFHPSSFRTIQIRRTGVPSRSSLPRQAPTPQESINALVRSMSLDQKLGQLLLVEYVGTSYQSSGLQYMISQQYVGGFVYEESNYNFNPPYNVSQNVKAFSEQAKQDAYFPPIIATDQEGGLVNRLYPFHGSLPSAQDIAHSGNTQFASKQGSQAAQWMEQLGINVDLAPVVDVQTGSSSVLESRTFGRTPQVVANYAGAFLNGLQENGIAGCLKHFPGLGAVTSDPHVGLPIVNENLQTLKNVDLSPYKLLIRQNHPAMIMSTDVLIPAIDPNLPASLSPKAIDGLLRDQLGYHGVVVTDGLTMAGISQKWTLSQAAVLSIKAGNDLLVGTFTPEQVADVVHALKQAIQQGTLSIERIDESLQRIFMMKYTMGLRMPFGAINIASRMEKGYALR